MRRVTLRKTAAEAVTRGHPWVWREGVARGLDGAAAGEEIEVADVSGRPIGRGVADPASPIAVRVWTRGRETVADLIRARVRGCADLRARLFAAGDTTAYRLVNGEGDRMPGVVVDRYADVAVVRTDGEGAAAWIEKIADALSPIADVLWKQPAQDLVVLRGAAPPERVTVKEHGVPFVVEIARGQKTGAFLDQRENRRRVGAMARGRRVLNLFSYAGGFSLHAAIGGATRVTSVDIAAAAHATAQATFRAAGVDAGAHAFVTADVGDFLARARERRETWDLVVSDPPSFARSEKTIPRALAAYRALHRACLDVLAPGGIFCASSCSSHVGAETFLSTLDPDLRLLELHGAGPDHPTLPVFPEGRYLKFALLSA